MMKVTRSTIATASALFLSCALLASCTAPSSSHIDDRDAATEINAPSSKNALSVTTTTALDDDAAQSPSPADPDDATIIEPDDGTGGDTSGTEPDDPDDSNGDDNNGDSGDTGDDSDGGDGSNNDGPDGSVPTSFRAERVTAEIGGCPLFTVDHYQNARFINRLPVHTKSDVWIQSIINAKPDANLGAPTSQIYNGSRSGFPLNVVDSRVTGKEYVMTHGVLAELGWQGHYPMPNNPMVEGYPSVQWDQHLFVVDQADCMAYELIMFEPRLKGIFSPFYSAEFGVRYPLNTPDRMRYTTNSPNTPMVSQYARPSEASEDRIDHAMSFCLNTISTDHVWPARDSDGQIKSQNTIPMGAWVRLKENVDLSNFHGQGKVIAQALKEHGMILTDSCGRHFGLMVESSSDWIDSEVAALKSLTPHLFEVVDTSPMMISEDTFQIR